MRTALCLGLVATLMWAPAFAGEVRIKGPDSPLGGEAILTGGADAVVVIVPGSGPTDRDGNSPKGLKTDAYKKLAEGLGIAGIASVRIDKRGMFRSASPDIDPNNVTVVGLGADIGAWVDATTRKTGMECAWVLGHSEGGLMALVAAQEDTTPICGLILVASPGRRLGTILRQQLKANPANAPILEGALRAIDALERGESPEFAITDFTLKRLFPESVQAYIMDLFAQDPARLAAAVDKPILIVQGTQDIQISQTDADALKSAQPKAVLKILDGMTHTLKVVETSDRSANAATYSDPSLPLHPDLVPAIVAFIRTQR